MQRRSSNIYGMGGSMAVEFALVLPVILIIFIAFLSMASFMLTRYHLTAAASIAARKCAVSAPVGLPGPNAACAAAEVVSYLTNMNMLSKCGGAPNVVANTQMLPGTNMWVYRVDVRCNYSDNIAGRFLADEGIRFGQISARGEMPVQQ